MFKQKIEKYVNFLWFAGDIEGLREYYQNYMQLYPHAYNNNFYAATDLKDMRVVHTGIPSTISKTIVDLVGISDVEINAENEIKQKLIDEFLKKKKVMRKMKRLIYDLTWSGECFIKFNFSVDYGLYLEIINPLNARFFEEYGEITQYEFIIAENEEEKTRVVEIYGKGFIRTEWQKQMNVDVLSKKEEDDDDDLHWVTYDTSLIEFSIDRILAFHAEVEEDAYTKSLQIFDAADENYSRMPQEQREGKMDKFMDESLIAKDDEGNVKAEENASTKNYVKLPGYRSEDGKPLIEHIMADIDPDKRYLKPKDAYTRDSVRNAGLSFYTYYGSDAKIAMSAQSQREMEKISIRTRKDYVNCMKDLMVDVFTTFLMLNNIKTIWQPVDFEKYKPIKKSKIPEETVEVIFNDYIKNDLESRMKIWGGMEAQQNFPLEFRIMKIMEGELTEDEIKKLVAKLELEQGIVLEADEGDVDEQKVEKKSKK